MEYFIMKNKKDIFNHMQYSENKQYHIKNIANFGIWNIQWNKKYHIPSWRLMDLK